MQMSWLMRSSYCRFKLKKCKETNSFVEI